MEPMLFGEILRNFHLASDEDIQRCLQIQYHGSQHRPLGEILIDEGLLDANMLSTILTVQTRELNAGIDELGISSHELSHRLAGGTGEDYVALARDIGASDLYLSAGKQPMVRLHGRLSDLPGPALDQERCEGLVWSLLSESHKADWDRDGRLDTCATIGAHGRFRINLFRHMHGVGAVIRVLNSELKSLDHLGLPDAVRDLTQNKHGLVLVTGTTGSGKSTTLAAMVNEINATQRRHVITLEDPIEMVIDSQNSLITQREVGTHTESFKDGLRAALREDPDVIVVGELRDLETFSVALTAAETGHLVLGTMHTKSAHATIVRIIDQFPANQRAHVRTMLAGVLRGVICQELLPTVQGDKRTLAAEVMIANPAIANLIRENRSWQIPNIMQTNKASGMQAMDDALEALLLRQEITVEEAVNRAQDRSRFTTPTSA